MSGDKCIFCNEQIMSKQRIKQFTDWFVINNNKPLAIGHLLVISRKHIRSLAEIDVLMWKSYREALHWAIVYIKKNHHKNPFTFINAPEGQSVFHFHHHLVPNYFGPNEFDEKLRSPSSET